MQQLQAIDYSVFFIYFVIVAAYGYWIYKRKQNKEQSSTDFFLAEGSLTWWAIGTSLIASNISAEQFIGMSGNGFSMGLAIATYEWMAAATLIIVGVFFMPIYLKNHIFTMPQFLRQRYNDTVATIMAVFWLFLYVLVNLTSILFLGALAVSTISGIDFWFCMISLAIFALIITIGGMKVIGYTDVIQVFFLILGGLATTYLAVNLVSEQNGLNGLGAGFDLMLSKSADHFNMIFERNNQNYAALPGLTVLFGGMWIVNLNYWGCNQYITQRALGADLKTARNGILFAAFLKLLMPLIVVIPGIAAYTLYQQGLFQTEMLTNGQLNQDRAYPVLLNLLPPGLKGLSFAALTAAVVASLAGKANSISTIYTLDIYKKFINKDASERTLVRIGRITILISLILAIIISPYMGIDKKGGFQFIQEMTGLVSPGVFAAFLMGFFWKRTNTAGAMFAIVGGFLLALFFKFLLPETFDLSGLQPYGFAYLNQEAGRYEIPFLDQMGFIFLICVAVMFVLGLQRPSLKGLEIDATMFRVRSGFALGSLVIVVILTFLYGYFW
ncbi:sodium:solute symporter family transporter [Tellurirhabdus rosea]|uniref:sodium:solute symporter family transporter n=1 Tax=Tellurirhabdus rosea TaxID=2674997 RepID=UPI002259EA98|nr:sodium/solute symporter [Tellurirhabdus rosea]